MPLSPRFSLPYITAGVSAQVNYNKAMQILEVLANGMIKDRDLTAPPAAANGDAYIVGASATGDWLDHDDEIAVWHDEWVFFDAAEGMSMWVEDEGVNIRRGSSTWKAITGECVFAAIDSSGAQSVPATASTVIHTFPTTIRAGSANVFTYSAGAITLKEAGYYEVSVDFACAVSGSASSNSIEGILTINGTEVTGSKVRLFITTPTTLLNHSGSLRMVINVSANDVLRFSLTKLSGAGTVVTVANCGRITIRKI